MRLMWSIVTDHVYEAMCIQVGNGKLYFFYDERIYLVDFTKLYMSTPTIHHMLSFPAHPSRVKSIGVLLRNSKENSFLNILESPFGMPIDSIILWCNHGSDKNKLAFTYPRNLLYQ